MIRIPSAGTGSMISRGRGPAKITLPPFTNGFEFQIAEVARCLDQDLTENPLLPQAFSLQLSETMDAIRKQIGV